MNLCYSTRQLCVVVSRWRELLLWWGHSTSHLGNGGLARN